MADLTTNPWGPLDLEQLRLLARVSVAKRIRAMLEAQAMAMGIVRGRLRRQYPHLTQREINLLVLKEVSRHG
ncbi:MAG: hypothetical protein ACE5MB_00480 [Anaerolineae bacterium]